MFSPAIMIYYASLSTCSRFYYQLFNPVLAIFALRINDLVIHHLLCAGKHMTLLNHTVNAARIG